MTDLPTIYGFNKTSDGGPDSFGISIFLSGCNMKCPYCMNSRLVNLKGLKEISFQEVSDYISTNKVEWVTISGGEPTVSKGLPNLIKRIKALGAKVNLCTNGLNPSMVDEVIDDLSYVTLDVKSYDPEIYRAWTSNPQDKSSALTNVVMTKCKLIISKLERHDFDYEIRTTIVPKFVDKQTISKLSGIIAKGEKWVLQKFRRTPDVSIEAGDEQISDEEIQKMAKTARKGGKIVEIRYI